VNAAAAEAGGPLWLCPARRSIDRLPRIKTTASRPWPMGDGLFDHRATCSAQVGWPSALEVGPEAESASLPAKVS